MLKSKRIGDIVEDEIIKHFQSMGHNAQKNEDKEKRYDYDIEVIVDDTTMITFEAKNDAMASKTGNIAIEHRNSKKNAPSGISVTKADYWAHKIDDEIWVCTVERLRKFVNEETPFKTIKSGGDKNADLFIFKIEHFTSICTPLSSITNINHILDMP